VYTSGTFTWKGRAQVVGEELAIDRGAAQLDPAHVGQAVVLQLRLRGHVNVELDAAVRVVEKVDAHLFLVDLIEQVDAAVRPLRHRRDVGPDQLVGLGHDAGIVAARAVDHVDHARAHRLGLIERRDRSGPADELELHHAPAGRVHLVEEFRKLWVQATRAPAQGPWRDSLPA
jgi:hypothetical protein